jgi:NitT/TauT family transport system substrate-binding protein
MVAPVENRIVTRIGSAGGARRVVCVVVCLAVSAAACATRGGESGSRVRIAIGGQNQMIYLPTTLAQELGFYRDEGVEVELQDFAGGSKALQALVGGSADVVSGFYDHTIQMAAEGRALMAFVTMLRRRAQARWRRSRT